MTATPETDALDPLDMARNLIAGVQRAAEKIEADELGAFIEHAGEYGHYAGQLAANLALVSLAEDVRRITDVLVRADDRLDLDREGP
jgi:hypothetical protein